MHNCMKIIFKDLKKGIIKLKVDNLDDMWHLTHILDKGDIVEAITYRKEDKQEDISRSKSRARKKVKLTLEVEKVELKDQLRVGGKILEGAETLGNYHTFNISENDKITIIKEKWKKADLERLDEAQKTTHKPRIFLIVLDDEMATFAILRQTSVDFILDLEGRRQGKQFESKNVKMKYFSEVLNALKYSLEGKNINKIILGGPGFIKDELYDYIKNKDIELSKKIVVTNTSVVGKTGIYELIKSKKVDKILADMKSAKEIEAVEELLYEIAKSKKGTYGIEQVKNAANMGAVNKLLVLDKKVRENSSEDIMEACRQTNSKIIIVSSSHEGGDKLETLGGVAAILRYII